VISALAGRDRGLGADVHFATLGEIDRRIEDDLIAGLNAFAHFDNCPKIARVPVLG